MRKKLLIGGSLLLFTLLGLTMVGPIMSNVEQPKYQVISNSDDIEIREYSAMIVAQVTVSGERKEAINQGFRQLADYIFGNNTKQQEIAMTAPVQQQSHETIAMTAPVQQQSSNGKWLISFVMPSQYTMQTLPKPSNESVMLREVPAKKFIVIRFSGSNNDENVSKHEMMLISHIEEHNIKTLGSPKYAFYNPPWTLPFLRRNEVMMEMAD